MKNLREMSNTELAELLTEVQEEQERRNSYEKREAWKQVQEAIENYVNTCGDINMFSRYNYMYLSKRMPLDWNTCGEIRISMDDE